MNFIKPTGFHTPQLKLPLARRSILVALVLGICFLTSPLAAQSNARNAEQKAAKHKAANKKAMQKKPAKKGLQQDNSKDKKRKQTQRTDSEASKKKMKGSGKTDKLKTDKLKTHEGVQATLWVQSSIEYQMACKQSYALATLRLRANLADKSFSAALEQKGDFSNLPPAIILDIDETSLDNSPFQARMVKNDGVFVPAEWTSWVNEAKASAVPGAKEFMKTAQQLGVQIVFVTNRSADTEAQTIKNLKDVFGFDVDKDMIHCKNERPEWGSNKNSRRQMVCESFRVIALIGDDYNDFAWIGKPTPQDRKSIGIQFEKQWGTAWFLLPNPLYGNWDKSLYDYDYNTSRKDVLKLKYDQLETKN